MAAVVLILPLPSVIFICCLGHVWKCEIMGPEHWIIIPTSSFHLHGYCMSMISIMHAGLGYHDDLKTRISFIEVLTSILKQGAEFNSLADTALADGLNAMIELVVTETGDDGDVPIMMALINAVPPENLVRLNITYNVHGWEGGEERGGGGGEGREERSVKFTPQTLKLTRLAFVCPACHLSLHPPILCPNYLPIHLSLSLSSPSSSFLCSIAG